MGWSACVQRGSEAPVADLFGLKGIHFSGNKATLAADPFGHDEATLRVWAIGFDGWFGFCLGKLIATWS